MTKEAADKAKELFDQELDQAIEEIVKRWGNIHKKSGNKFNLADLLKKPGKRA